jgi:hypothetical protein
MTEFGSSSYYAFRFDHTDIATGSTKTNALLTTGGDLYLGNFNGYNSGLSLNTKRGIGIFGTGQSNMTMQIHGMFGHTFSWEATTSATGISRNMTFRYANGSPFFQLTPEAKVLIGTNSAPGDYMLYIGGKAIAEEVVVKLQTKWPDYVFEPTYTMLTNAQLRAYIAQNGKLPYLPSATEVAENGVALGETQTQLTRLVEELTLRLLEMEERVQELESQLAEE